MTLKDIVKRLQEVCDFVEDIENIGCSVTVQIIIKDVKKGFMRDLNIMVMKAEKKIRAIKEIKKESEFEN